MHSFSKDGMMLVENVSDPVDVPISKGGPQDNGKPYPQVEVWKASGEFIRAAYTLRKDDGQWSQAGICGLRRRR